MWTHCICNPAWGPRADRWVHTGCNNKHSVWKETQERINFPDFQVIHHLDADRLTFRGPDESPQNVVVFVWLEKGCFMPPPPPPTDVVSHIVWDLKGQTEKSRRAHVCHPPKWSATAWPLIKWVQCCHLQHKYFSCSQVNLSCDWLSHSQLELAHADPNDETRYGIRKDR